MKAHRGWAVFLILMACPSGEKAVAPKDEACTNSADCAGGLLCIDSTCVSPAEIKGIGQADPATTQVTFDRNEVPADGVESVKVQIALRDADGLVPASTAVSLAFEGTAIEADQKTVIADASGLVTFTLKSKAPFESPITVSWQLSSGTVNLVAPTPLRFVQAQADPDKSSISFTRTLAVLADGLDYTEASIKLVTAAGGTPYGATVALTSDEPGVFASGSNKIDAQGNAKIQLRSRKSGTKTIHVMTNGEYELTEKPQIVFQIAAVIINGSMIVAQDNKLNAIADNEDFVDLMLVVPTATGGASRDVTIVVSTCSEPATTCEDVSTPVEPSSLHLRVRTTVARKLPVAVTVNGSAVTLGITELTFDPGPADAMYSYLSIGTERASKNFAVALSLRSADKFNNVRKADNVTVVSNATLGNLPVVPVVTDALGLWTANVSGAVATIHTITATFFGGLTLTQDFLVTEPWTARPSTFPAGVSSTYVNPRDLDHVLKWGSTVLESHDGGMSFQSIATGLPASVRDMAITPSATPRVWAILTTNTLWYKDGAGPWTQFSPTPPAPPTDAYYYRLAVGGNDQNSVALLVPTYCSGAGCDGGPWASYNQIVYSYEIYRYTATLGWTITSMQPIAAADATNVDWIRYETISFFQMDDNDSGLVFFDAYLSSYHPTDNSQYSPTIFYGLYALPANSATRIKLTTGNDTYALDGTSDRAIITGSNQRLRVNSAGTGHDTEAVDLSLPAGIYSAHRMAGALQGATVVAAMCTTATPQAIYQKHVPGTGWQAVFDGAPMQANSLCYSKRPVAAGSDRVVTSAYLVERANTPPRFMAQQPSCSYWTPMLNRKVLCRNNAVSSVHDGTQWMHYGTSYDDYPESNGLMPGLDDDTFYEIIRGGNTYLTYERKISTGAATAAVGSTYRLFWSPSIPGRRFRALNSYPYPVQMITPTTGWTTILSASEGVTTIGSFAMTPTSAIKYRVYMNKLQTYTSSWADVPSNGGITGSPALVFADPREDGTIFVTTNTAIWKGNGTTMTEFATFTGTPTFMQFPADAPTRINVFTANQFATTTGGAISWTACAAGGTGFNFDPNELRHIVSSTITDNYSYCQ